MYEAVAIWEHGWWRRPLRSVAFDRPVRLEARTLQEAAEEVRRRWPGLGSWYAPEGARTMEIRGRGRKYFIWADHISRCDTSVIMWRPKEISGPREERA